MEPRTLLPIGMTNRVVRMIRAATSLWLLRSRRVELYGLSLVNAIAVTSYALYKVYRSLEGQGRTQALLSVAVRRK